MLGRIALTTADGRPVRSVIAQPKRTALLACLAVRDGNAVSRDLLVETLWPELEPERGRAALRKGLYFLRQSLGSDSIVAAGGQVAVSHAVFCSDVAEFERAVSAGDVDRAVAVYGGDLLPGLVVTGAPDWDIWVDGQRARLRRMASDAAANGFRTAQSRADDEAAWRYLVAALAIDPIDDAAVQRMLCYAAQSAQPHRGVHLYEEHRARLAAEWEIEPSAESRRLAGELAARRRPPAALPQPVGIEPVVVVEQDRLDGDSASAHPAHEGGHASGIRRNARAWAALAAVLALVLLAVPLRSRLASAGGTGPRAPAASARALASDDPAATAAPISNSQIALRFYQEGRRLYMQGSAADARPLFSAALAEDSTFAMAAYFLAVSAPEFDHDMLQRAARLAERQPERERLLIRTGWLQYMDDPRRLAVAESLVVRYPQDMRGHLALGRAQFWGGDFEAALTTLRGVVAAESAGEPRAAGSCRACEAWFDLSSLYLHVDSGVAAERVARDYLSRYPDSDRGWDMLINALEHQSRYAELQPALARFAALTGDEDDAYVRRAGAAIRQGDFATADSLLTRREPFRQGTRALQLWYRMISLRNQARLAEALELAADYDALQVQRGDPDSNIGQILRAIVWQEAGQHARAAALFERVAKREPNEAPSRRARHAAWNLTHAATAYAALGDTSRLRVLADSVQRVGALSAYGRDRRLHHHIRGLDAGIRGDTATAIRQLRTAMFSTTHGYTRTNLELGRLLNATGEYAEAVHVLEPALRGTLSSSQLYVTHADLHRELLVARRAMGQPERAQAHADWLARAGLRNAVVE